jgi:hypothetical protein
MLFSFDTRIDVADPRSVKNFKFGLSKNSLVGYSEQAFEHFRDDVGVLMWQQH